MAWPRQGSLGAEVRAIPDCLAQGMTLLQRLGWGWELRPPVMEILEVRVLRWRLVEEMGL